MRIDQGRLLDVFGVDLMKFEGRFGVRAELVVDEVCELLIAWGCQYELPYLLVDLLHLL